MCLICVDFEKSKMTWQEAFRATYEMSNEDPHKKELIENLLSQIDERGSD